MELWRHKKTSSLYLVLGIGLCSTNGPRAGNEESVIYFSISKQRWHYRDAKEFYDGRFERLAPQEKLPALDIDAPTGTIEVAPGLYVAKKSTSIFKSEKDDGSFNEIPWAHGKKSENQCPRCNLTYFIDCRCGVEFW